MSAVSDRDSMVGQMHPVLRPGVYVFVPAPPRVGDVVPVMSFVEDEGVTWIVLQELADGRGLEYDVLLRWITLRVESSLEGVGLTAAVSTELAAQGIACNVVAALHHDHLFVPASDAERALASLRGLAARTT